MKKVLLLGVHSDVGYELYESFKDTYDIYAFSTFEQDNVRLDINYLKVDLFDLAAVTKGLKDIDIVIFFDDPILRLSRKTQGKMSDLIKLVADTIARASAINNVEQIIYVRDEIGGYSLAEILSAYGTPVSITKTDIKRQAKGLGYRTHSRKEYRSVSRSVMPEGWSIKDVAKYYFEWLSNIVFDVVRVEFKEDTVSIYLAKVSSPALKFKLNKSMYHKGIVSYDVISGFLINDSDYKTARFEFRELKGRGEFILGIHDFEPSLPWGLFSFTHAPIQALINRIYRVEMIIIDKPSSNRIEQEDESTN